MPAFSDERLIDAAGTVVADRPEQRPLLVVAVASRFEVVVEAPPYPSHGAFCRSRALDREHQAVSALAQCLTENEPEITNPFSSPPRKRGSRAGAAISAPLDSRFRGNDGWGVGIFGQALKRRSSCLSPSLGAYGLQNPPPRSGQPNTAS
jgi:hypothetical protein